MNYLVAFQFTHEFFLPTLPQLNSLGISSKPQEDKSFAKGTPSFLVVILKNGKVHLLLLGALKAGSIDMSQHVASPEDLEVYDVRLSGDFNSVFALVRDGKQLRLLHFRNSVLKDYLSPMMQLALHCANVLDTKQLVIVALIFFLFYFI